jgi:hypothetical protein
MAHWSGSQTPTKKKKSLTAFDVFCFCFCDAWVFLSLGNLDPFLQPWACLDLWCQGSVVLGSFVRTMATWVFGPHHIRRLVDECAYKDSATARSKACSVRGLVVMIVACQVMDPGSIPGERNFLFFFVSAKRKSTEMLCSHLPLPSKTTSEAGFEPATFCLGGRRAIHCATRTDIGGERGSCGYNYSA